jgi:photosystem II stability/assembly factor-like uncharacterized protein
MPTLHRFAALMLVVLAGALPAAAGVDRWTFLGPDGGAVLALAADPGVPGTVYAGTDRSGVWKSVDGGVHWACASEGLDSPSVLALAAVPGTPGVVYAGTPIGIFKTADGGATWQLVWSAAHGPGDLFTSRVLSLAAAPGDPEAVWAGTNHGEVLRTSDGGLTWSTDFTTPGGVSDLDIAPGDPSTVYAVAGGSLYRRGTTGSWTRLIDSTGPAIPSALAIDPENPRVLYLAAQFGVWKSEDAGATWRRPPPIDDVSLSQVVSLLVDPSDPSIVLAGTSSGGLFRSVDAGVTWARVPGLPQTGGASLAVDPARPGTVWLGSSGLGVFASHDSGRTWVASRNGLAASQALAAAFDPFRPRTLYAGLVQTGVHRSTDAGAIWRQTNTGIMPSGGSYGRIVLDLAVHPTQPGTLYAAATSGLYESRDRGTHWRPLPAGPEEIAAVAVDPHRPSILWAGGDRLLRSRNGGRTWKISLVPACGNDTTVSRVMIDPLRPGTLFLVTLDERHLDPDPLARSIDGGTTWECQNDLFASALAFSPRTSGLLYAVDARDVWRSADGGASWSRVAEDPAAGIGLTALLADALDPAVLYLGTAGAGTLRSRDGGATWAPLASDLPAASIHCLEADPRNPRHLVACTEGGGLLEIRLSD